MSSFLGPLILFQENHHAWAFLLTALIKSSAILLLAFFVCRLLSNRPAKIRSSISRAAFALLFVLLLLQWQGPWQNLLYPVEIERPPSFSMVQEQPAMAHLLEVPSPGPSISVSSTIQGSTIPEIPAPTKISLPQLENLLPALWFGIGLLLVALKFIRASLAFWGLRKTSLPVNSSEAYFACRLSAPLNAHHPQAKAAERCAQPTEDQEGVSNPGAIASKTAALLTQPVPELYFSTILNAPLLTGWLKPVIHLPPASLDWSTKKLEAVFLHELAHWKRRDIHWQAIASCIQCLWWWNPLAWFALGKLRAEDEKAADEEVIRHRQETADYAQILLEIAKDSLPSSRVALGIPMLGRSQLEQRIRNILSSGSLKTRLGLGGSLLIVLLIIGTLACGGWNLVSKEATKKAPASLPTENLKLQIVDAPGVLNPEPRDPTGKATLKNVELSVYEDDKSSPNSTPDALLLRKVIDAQKNRFEKIKSLQVLFTNSVLGRCDYSWEESGSYKFVKPTESIAYDGSIYRIFNSQQEKTFEGERLSRADDPREQLLSVPLVQPFLFVTMTGGLDDLRALHRSATWVTALGNLQSQDAKVYTENEGLPDERVVLYREIRGSRNGLITTIKFDPKKDLLPVSMVQTFDANSRAEYTYDWIKVPGDFWFPKEIRFTTQKDGKPPVEYITTSDLTSLKINQDFPKDFFSASGPLNGATQITTGPAEPATKDLVLLKKIIDAQIARFEKIESLQLTFTSSSGKHDYAWQAGSFRVGQSQGITTYDGTKYRFFDNYGQLVRELDPVPGNQNDPDISELWEMPLVRCFLNLTGRPKDPLVSMKKPETWEMILKGLQSKNVEVKVYAENESDPEAMIVLVRKITYPDNRIMIDTFRFDPKNNLVPVSLDQEISSSPHTLYKNSFEWIKTSEGFWFPKKILTQVETEGKVTRESATGTEIDSLKINQGFAKDFFVRIESYLDGPMKVQNLPASKNPSLLEGIADASQLPPAKEIFTPHSSFFKQLTTEQQKTFTGGIEKITRFAGRVFSPDHEKDCSVYSDVSKPVDGPSTQGIIFVTVTNSKVTKYIYLLDHYGPQWVVTSCKSSVSSPGSKEDHWVEEPRSGKLFDFISNCFDPGKMEGLAAGL